MKVLITNRQNKSEFTKEMNTLIKKAVRTVISGISFKGDFEVSVLICDDGEIRSLNAEHRNKDSSTDVLSFPMLEFVREEEPAELIPQDEIFPLGDIVISLETAERQAAEYGHSLARELAFLTVHSMLHLAGYDHEAEQDRIKMRTKEEAFLEDLSLKR